MLCCDLIEGFSSTVFHFVVLLFQTENGKQVLSVVAVMLKISGIKRQVSKLAPVRLLDWYDLDQELILYW